MPQGIINVHAILSSFTCPRMTIYHQMKPEILKFIAHQSVIITFILHRSYILYNGVKAEYHSHTLVSSGFFIDKMSDYGMGFLMAGVALIVSALFLLLLNQMNRRAGR